MPDLLTQFELLQGRVKDAERQAASAKDVVEEAKTAHAYALADLTDAMQQLATIRDYINRALEIADQGPLPGRRQGLGPISGTVPANGDPSPHGEPTVSGAVPPGIQPAVWALVLAMPLDGDLDKQGLEAAMPTVTANAVNTRLAKARKAGLVDSAGWGQHKLTQEAKELREQPLRLLSPEE